MRRCSVKPYEGNENYIFISYCHRDKHFVFPIIEQMAYDGYRVWYDEGIDPGSEWPEVIARHLNNCSTCIAFLSNRSLDSHNCRREINFALLKKKDFISLILEPVEMSLGMEMQLSANQSIYKYLLPEYNEFFAKLYEAKCIEACKGNPDPSIVISKPEDYDYSDGISVKQEVKIETFSDKWFKGEEPVRDEDKYKTMILDDDMTVQEPPKPKIKAILVRRKTNESFVIEEGEYKLGRSDTMADIVIYGNSTVGRIHAIMIMNSGRCFIIDNNSKNKTYLNGEELKPQEKYGLKDGDNIRLANENLTFHLEEDEK